MSRIRRRFAKLVLHGLEDRFTPATYTVTNTLDSGAGSLRVALASANATATVDDVINITATGTLTLISTLSVTDTVTINGPGANLFGITGNDSFAC